jgi:hypothetical protein
MTEVSGIVPRALELGFVDRLEEYVTAVQLGKLGVGLCEEGMLAHLDNQLTGRQFTRLGRNMEEQGLTDRLGPDGRRAPWTGMMRIMDEVTFAEATLNQEGPPKHMLLVVKTTSTRARDDLHGFYEHMLAGTHGPTRPEVRATGPREIRVNNFSHPDACTPGRAATSWFAQENADLGRNLRLILQRNLDQIEASGVTAVMRPELVARMDEQRETLAFLGEENPGGTLLTSGNLSLIGSAVRRALKDTGPLDMQRPRGHRPAVEDGAVFYTRKSSSVVGLPVSGTTLGRTLQGQIMERVEDIVDPVKKRQLIVAGERIWGILSGLGVNEGVGSAVRALATVSMATGVALKGTVTDKYTRQHAR